MILLTPYLISHAITCSPAPTIPGVFLLAIPLTGQTHNYLRAFAPTACTLCPEHPFHKYHHGWCLHCIQVSIQNTHDCRGIPDHAPQVAIPTLLLHSITCFVFIPTVSHLMKYSFYDCAYLPSVFHYKNKHENEVFILFIVVLLAPRTVPSTQ